MAAAAKSIAVRLTLEGGQKVKAELQGVGDTGDRALKQIASSTAPASTGLKALNAVTGQLRSGIEGMGGAAGPAARALSGLGLAGSAAAVGVGALAAAFTVAYRAAGQALERVGKMTDQADQLGLSFERFQELEYVFASVGVGTDQMTRAMTKFSDAIGQVLAEGEDAPKELLETFERLGISVKEIDATGGDAYKVLQLVSDGLAGMGSRAEQTAALVDLFGTKNAALIPILARGAESLDAQTAAAHEAGRVNSNELGASYDKLGDQSAQLTIAIENQTARLVEGMLPAVIAAKEAHLALLDAIERATKYMPSFDTAVAAAVAALGPLANMLYRVAKLMGVVGGGAGAVPSDPGGLDVLVKSVDARAAALDKATARPPRTGKTSKGTKGKTAAERAAETAAKQAAADKKVIDDLARSIETYGDARQQQIDQAVSRLSPTASADQRKEVERLSGAMFDQAAAAKHAAEAQRDYDQAAQEAARDQQAYLDSLPTEAERLYASREFSDGLKRGLSDWAEDASNAAAIAESAVQSAADGMADAITEFVMTGKANFADFATAVIAEINRMMVRMLIAMAIQRAIGVAVGSGTTTGGSGDTTFHSGPGSDSLVAHTGGIIGEDALPRRHSILDAPRYHTGAMAGEVPAVLEPGEGVFTKGQMRALGRRMQPITITVNNNARAAVDVQQTENGAQIDIADLIDRTTAGLAATPGTRLNRALRR